MSILDDVPFPKGEPDAQRLVRLMAGLFREEIKSIEFAALYGFDDLKLPPGLAPLDRWYCILEQLAEARRVRECVQAAREKFTDNTALSFLESLLAVVAIRMDLTPGFQPWQHLGLFDRTIESSILAERLFPYATPEPLKPLIIGVLAERADEYTYFLERVRDEILYGLYDNTQWQEEWIHWAPTADVSAEFELRKIAAKKPGGNKGTRAELLSRLPKALAGRSMWLMLRSNDLRQPDMLEKFSQFLSLWGELGTGTPPPVLCVAIVRWDDGDLSLTDAEPLAAAAFDRARDGGAIAVNPVVRLSMCEVSDFDQWAGALTGLGRKIDQMRFENLKKKFTAPFRLGHLKDRLAEGPIYS